MAFVNTDYVHPSNTAKMKNLCFLSGLVLILFTACQSNSNESTDAPKVPVALSTDFVHEHILPEIRLGDGVPLQLDVTLRWNVTDSESFFQRFPSPDTFNLLVLRPRALELLRTTANTFESVDSVFSAHRQAFLAATKEVLISQLGEPQIAIREVIVSNIRFPNSYTKAMEEVGLMRQELERIKQQNTVALARAETSREQANADGQVAIAQAESAGRLQKIQAETEKSRRASELAKAETTAQVTRLQARAEADRQRELAKAEADRQHELAKVEVDRQKALKSVEAGHKRELEQVQIDKQKQLDKVEFERQIELAKLCTENPTYAAFLVNKELASKVEIAVLPTGADANVFGNILNQRIKN